MVFCWLDLNMGVSKNWGTPKSSSLIGFSIINHPFWGIPVFGNTHMMTQSFIQIAYKTCSKLEKKNPRHTRLQPENSLTMHTWTKSRRRLPRNNLFFLVVVSVGWCQIFTWKIAVSPNIYLKNGCWIYVNIPRPSSQVSSYFSSFFFRHQFHTRLEEFSGCTSHLPQLSAHWRS